MSNRYDLTDDRAFSTRRLPKIIKTSRFPWGEKILNFKPFKLVWEQYKWSCDRCGAATQLLPWVIELPWFCQRCAGLLAREKLPWEDELSLRDKYNSVFLTEFMDRRR